MSNIDNEHAYQVVSTQTNRLLRLAAYLEVRTDIDTGYLWYDPLGPKILRLLELPRPLEYLYNPSLTITSQAAYVYGSTSAWWIVLLLSGKTHPIEITQTQSIFLPTLDSLLSLVNVTTSSVGKVVSF